MRLQKCLVSIGKSCQSAHQLARFAADHPAKTRFQKGPFDWLICPPKSAVDWLDAGLPDFKPSEISEHRGHAYWERFDFWFWHGFFTREENGSRLDIAANMERELSKLTYQRQLFQSLDPARTVFVMSNSQNNLSSDVFEAGEEEKYHFDHASHDAMTGALENYFKAPVTVRLASRHDRANLPQDAGSNLHLFPLENSEWKGSDADWDAFLHTVVANL